MSFHRLSLRPSIVRFLTIVCFSGLLIGNGSVRLASAQSETPQERAAKLKREEQQRQKNEQERQQQQQNNRSSESSSSSRSSEGSTERHSDTRNNSSGAGRGGSNGSTTYSPGAGRGTTQGTNRSGASSRDGVTTYTPSRGGTPATTAKENESSVRTEDGVTTYTPRSDAGSGVSPSGAAAYLPGGEPAPNSLPHPAVSAVYQPATPSLHPVYRLPSSSAPIPDSGSRRLTPVEAQSVEKQLNAARASLNGLNRRPLPPGEIKVRPGGSLSIRAIDGRQFDVRPNGTIASIVTHDRTATFRSNGTITSMRTPTLEVRRYPRGGQTVAATRDGILVVGTAPHRGFVQKSITVNGRPLVRRTYVGRSGVFTRLYSPYEFHHIGLQMYVPSRYMAPLFYGWLYYPYDNPVPFPVPADAQEALANYYAFFNLPQYYPSGYLWAADRVLVDYLQNEIDSMQAAQQDQAQTDAPAGGDQQADSGDYLEAPQDAPITPQIQDAIAEEVRNQIAYLSASSTGAVPENSGQLGASLTPDRVFVVSAPLVVTTLDGGACAVTPGDVLRLSAPPADNADAANLVVIATRRGDCPAAVMITVAYADLGEMQNDMRAGVEDSVEQLYRSQGQGGYPAAPQKAMASAPTQAFDGSVMAPDPGAGAAIESVARDATAAEKSAAYMAFPPPPKP
jgi:hypothetical protein